MCLYSTYCRCISGSFRHLLFSASTYVCRELKMKKRNKEGGVFLKFNSGVQRRDSKSERFVFFFYRLFLLLFLSVAGEGPAGFFLYSSLVGRFASVNLTSFSRVPQVPATDSPEASKREKRRRRRQQDFFLGLIKDSKRLTGFESVTTFTFQKFAFGLILVSAASFLSFLYISFSSAHSTSSASDFHSALGLV